MINVKVTYKNKERFGKIVETKLNKLKIAIYDGNKIDSGNLIAYDWFDNKQIKRLWN